MNLRQSFRRAARALLIGLPLLGGLGGCDTLGGVTGYPIMNSYAPNSGPNDPNPFVDSCRDSTVPYGANWFLKDGGQIYVLITSDPGATWYQPLTGGVSVTLPGLPAVPYAWDAAGLHVGFPAVSAVPLRGGPVSQDYLRNLTYSYAKRYFDYTDDAFSNAKLWPRYCLEPKNRRPGGAPVATPLQIPGIN